MTYEEFVQKKVARWVDVPASCGHLKRRLLPAEPAAASRMRAGLEMTPCDPCARAAWAAAGKGMTNAARARR